MLGMSKNVTKPLKPAAKPLQIFKPGRHTAMSGAVLSFSAADLVATAGAYDPALHEAPIVVGHPVTDGPAYGWIQGLDFAEGGLEARPSQVNPEFAELVNAGAFKKISASFYAPDAPANPAPGVYYLRHVGFLGAQAPAVKGLRAPSFAADETGVIEFGDGFGNGDDQSNASLWRGLRDWLLTKFGQDDADRAVPSFYVAGLETSAAQPEPAVEATDNAPLSAYAESITQETLVTPEEKAALEAENARLKADLAAATARDKAAAADARHAANAAFAEQLAAEGKLLPAQQLVAVATLDFVAAQEAPVEFGEGDAKKPLAEAFKEFLQALPKQVEFGETATRDRAGEAVSESATTIAARATEFQDAEARAGRSVSIAHAVAHVTRK